MVRLKSNSKASMLSPLGKESAVHPDAHPGVIHKEMSENSLSKGVSDLSHLSLNTENRLL